MFRLGSSIINVRVLVEAGQGVGSVVSIPRQDEGGRLTEEQCSNRGGSTDRGRCGRTGGALHRRIVDSHFTTHTGVCPTNVCHKRPNIFHDIFS